MPCGKAQEHEQHGHPRLTQNEHVLRSALLIGGLAVLHAAVTLALFVYAMSPVMAQFDDPAYQVPTTAVVAGSVAEIFMLPLAPLWSRWASIRLPNG